MRPDPSGQADIPDNLWTRPSRATRGPTPRYSAARIADTAIALADERGLAAVSMRTVATTLGTGPGSLYRYLASRDQLVDLMVDRVLAGDDAEPIPGADWLDRMVQLARVALEVHRRHPWMSDAIAEPRVLGPNALDRIDRYLEVLAPLDRPIGLKMELIALINGLVALFGSRERHHAGRTLSNAEILGAVDSDRHPHLAGALAAGSASTDEVEAEPGDLLDQAVRALAGGILHPPGDGRR